MLIVDSGAGVGGVIAVVEATVARGRQWSHHLRLLIVEDLVEWKK